MMTRPDALLLPERTLWLAPNPQNKTIPTAEAKLRGGVSARVTGLVSTMFHRPIFHWKATVRNS